MNGAFPATDARLGLYPVVDSVEWIERLLGAGVHTIQLRIKDQPADQAEPDIIRSIALGRRYQARLFINDYWQLAVKHQAYGVHLGQEDLDTADLDAIRAAGLRLGVSTHDDAELARAVAIKPSYIALGHIFPHPNQSDAVRAARVGRAGSPYPRAGRALSHRRHRRHQH